MKLREALLALAAAAACALAPAGANAQPQAATAKGTTYNPGSSSLTSTNVQDAIDEAVDRNLEDGAASDCNGLFLRGKVGVNGIECASSAPGSGEANQLRNDGGGVEIGKAKEGAILPIRTLVASTNITINQVGDTIEISAAGVEDLSDNSVTELQDVSALTGSSTTLPTFSGAATPARCVEIGAGGDLVQSAAGCDADDLSDDAVSALSDVSGKSGSATTLATAGAGFTGTNECVERDANGDLVTTGAGCGSGGGGHVIEEDGTPLAQRANLDFTGAGITCSDADPDTACDVPQTTGTNLTGSGATTPVLDGQVGDELQFKQLRVFVGRGLNLETSNGNPVDMFGDLDLDTTPQLGGDLDTNDQEVQTTVDHTVADEGWRMLPGTSGWKGYGAVGGNRSSAFWSPYLTWGYYFNVGGTGSGGDDHLHAFDDNWESRYVNAFGSRPQVERNVDFEVPYYQAEVTGILGEADFVAGSEVTFDDGTNGRIVGRCSTVTTSDPFDQALLDADTLGEDGVSRECVERNDWAGRAKAFDQRCTGAGEVCRPVLTGDNAGGNQKWIKLLDLQDGPCEVEFGPATVTADDATSTLSATGIDAAFDVGDEVQVGTCSTSGSPDPLSACVQDSDCSPGTCETFTNAANQGGFPVIAEAADQVTVGLADGQSLVDEAATVSIGKLCRAKDLSGESFTLDEGRCSEDPAKTCVADGNCTGTCDKGSGTLVSAAVDREAFRWWMQSTDAGAMEATYIYARNPWEGTYFRISQRGVSMGNDGSQPSADLDVKDGSFRQHWETPKDNFDGATFESIATDPTGASQARGRVSTTLARPEGGDSQSVGFLYGDTMVCGLDSLGQVCVGGSNPGTACDQQSDCLGGGQCGATNLSYGVTRCLQVQLDYGLQENEANNRTGTMTALHFLSPVDGTTTRNDTSNLSLVTFEDQKVRGATTHALIDFMAQTSGTGSPERLITTWHRGDWNQGHPCWGGFGPTTCDHEWWDQTNELKRMKVDGAPSSETDGEAYLTRQVECARISPITGADDQVVFAFPRASTVLSVWCGGDGWATTPPQVSLEDAQGNALTHGGDYTCVDLTAGTPATPAACTAGCAFSAGEGIRYDTDTDPDPTTNDAVVCFDFTY